RHARVEQPPPERLVEPGRLRGADTVDRALALEEAHEGIAQRLLVLAEREVARAELGGERGRHAGVATTASSNPKSSAAFSLVTRRASDSLTSFNKPSSTSFERGYVLSGCG